MAKARRLDGWTMTLTPALTSCSTCVGDRGHRRSQTVLSSRRSARTLPVPPPSSNNSCTHTHTHTRPFNGPFSGTTRVSRYQKGKTNLDFAEARDNEWQWHQLGHMQVCISLQTDNHASTSPLSFLQAGCHSRRPTNSVKALKQ